MGAGRHLRGLLSWQPVHRHLDQGRPCSLAGQRDVPGPPAASGLPGQVHTSPPLREHTPAISSCNSSAQNLDTSLGSARQSFLAEIGTRICTWPLTVLLQDVCLCQACWTIPACWPDTPCAWLADEACLHARSEAGMLSQLCSPQPRPPSTVSGSPGLSHTHLYMYTWTRDLYIQMGGQKEGHNPRAPSSKLPSPTARQLQPRT